jgi:hypothetical protein
VRERAESEPELLQRGSGFVFYALIDNIVDRYFPLVDALEVELEKIEDHIFEGEAGEKAHANMRALYRLKHKGMTVRHAVEPLIEGIHKLYGGRVPQPCSNTQEYFRDVYDHLLRISTQLDGLRDMFNTAMQVNISMISLSENAVTKRLAAYGALLAVPTMLVGVWGMNFKHMPELDWELGYPLSLAVMAIIDVLLWRRFGGSGGCEPLLPRLRRGAIRGMQRLRGSAPRTRASPGNRHSRSAPRCRTAPRGAWVSISLVTSDLIASVTPMPSIAASMASAASLKCGPRVASMSVTPTDCSQSFHDGRAPSSLTGVVVQQRVVAQVFGLAQGMLALEQPRAADGHVHRREDLVHVRAGIVPAAEAHHHRG